MDSFFDGAFVDGETGESHLPELRNWKESPHSLLMYLRGLGRLGCTDEEICMALRIDAKEWKAFIDENPQAMAIYYQGASEGKIALRRKQMQRAMQGSDAMLKHLGKHMLGQHDQMVVHDGRLSKAERLALLEEVERRHEARLVDVTPVSSGGCREHDTRTRDAISITQHTNVT